MTFLEQNKSLEELKKDWIQQWFLKSKSHNSKRGAEKAIGWFEIFLDEKYQGQSELQILEDLKLLANDPAKSAQVYLFINSFVQYLNQKGKAVRTVKIYTMFIKSWFRFNGIKVYTDDMKQFVNFPKLVRERRQPVTLEIIQALLKCADPKYKALILCCVSSGARIGEILQATVSDFDFTRTPVRFRIRAETTKTREERETFISRQAAEALKPIIEGKEKTDTIFSKRFEPVNTIDGIEKAFRKIRESAGFTNKYSNGMSIVNIHSFRAFFFTKAAKKHGENYAHAMIGHHAYLDQYFRETSEEQAKQYLELEPELTISL